MEVNAGERERKRDGGDLGPINFSIHETLFIRAGNSNVFIPVPILARSKRHD